MRFDQLMRYEPFSEILCGTLGRFLPVLTGGEHSVEWFDGPSGWKRIRRNIGPEGDLSEMQVWYCNKYLNTILLPSVERRLLEPSLREFSRSTSAWKRPLQKAYVLVASRYPFVVWLAHGGIVVRPPVPRGDTMLIVGGNHKLRVLDHRDNRSYAVLKDGYDPQFFEREIRGRRIAESLSLPVPSLYEVSASGGWFAEELVVGTPLNRLPRSRERARAMGQVWEALDQLHAATVEEIRVTDYVESLAGLIREGIADCSLLEDRKRGIILSSVGAIEKLLAESSGEIMTTAISHGDLQPANILVNGDRVWLIDWENTGRRQTAYDALVFALRSRFPVGLSRRIRGFLNGATDSLRSAELDALRRGSTRRQLRLTIGAFLLEETAVRLAENKDSQRIRLDSGFTHFVNEFEGGVQCL